MAVRREDTAHRRAPALPRVDKRNQAQLLSALPFSLTDGQLGVLDEITSDLQRTIPMTRLLQGEVGSGKTIVALAAMLQAVDNGMQCALLAPTEVLTSTSVSSSWMSSTASVWSSVTCCATKQGISPRTCW